MEIRKEKTKTTKKDRKRRKIILMHDREGLLQTTDILKMRKTKYPILDIKNEDTNRLLLLLKDLNK